MKSQSMLVKSQPHVLRRILFRAIGLVLALNAGAVLAETPAPYAPPGGVQGYVLTNFFWAMYETKNATECPKKNPGPNEQIRAQFPGSTGGVLLPGKSLEEIVLEREAARYWPELSDPKNDPLPWEDYKGKIAIGLDLDGKVEPHDFTAPTPDQCKAVNGFVHKMGDLDATTCTGEPGIDNELNRVLGCVSTYRTGGGTVLIDEAFRSQHFNRTVMELTRVENLQNDDDVTVTFYRALDPVPMDGAGKPMVGTTQRIDAKRGSRFVHRFHGKIVDGILSTEPADYVFPFSQNTKFLQIINNGWMRGMRLRLKLTPQGGEGIMAGYTDVTTFYNNNAKGRFTQNSASMSAPSLWRQLHLRADGYPDPVTGKNTAISAAALVKFTQTFIQHPPARTAATK
jgi:hypothetical protein